MFSARSRSCPTTGSAFPTVSWRVPRSIRPKGVPTSAPWAAAANFGRANRQLLTDGTCSAFATVLGKHHLELLYDVSHNLAKLETHRVDGAERLVCVHRKGATRALPPDHPNFPSDLKPFGQPVLIPGSMGTASYVLSRVNGNDAVDSACHGAGRVMSRPCSDETDSGQRGLAEKLPSPTRSSKSPSGPVSHARSHACVPSVWLKADHDTP